MENNISAKTIKKEKDLEIATRINKRMQELNIEQKDLFDKFSFEVAQGTLSKWLSLNPKINNGIKVDILKEFAQILDTNTEYLLYGSNDKKQTKNLPNFITKVNIKNGCVGAGSSGLLQEDEIIKELYVDTHQIVKKFREYKINGIQVVGDSMSPYVNNGDIILYVNIPDNYPRITGKYIISLNGNLQVKNISFRINGDIIISSENKSYPDEIIEKDSQELDNFEIVGIIAGRILKE
ncbi:S24 family peptidase [Aliarcobacter lanthieri]|uniref:S24 family peptidase n=1 Tax=Aliarcobacter lanthieri TaxID=1355374 RepID=UPI003AA887C0